MKKEVIVLLLMLFIILVSLNSYSAVLINEIMYDPSPSQGSDSFSEWIEIFNDDVSQIDLTNASLCGNSLLKGFINHSDGSIKLNTTFILESSNFALITDGGSGTEVYDNFTVEPSALAFHVSDSSMCSSGLSNSGEVINLTIGSESHIINYTQFVTLFPDTKNNGKTLIFYKGNFTESAFVNGTPGSSNDEFAPDFNKWVNPSANNLVISGLLNITINATDATNVSSALVSFNNTNFSMDKLGDLWHFLWNTRLNANKQYNITVFFNDSYGASGFDRLFNITVNNTNNPPQVLSANLTNTDFLNRTNGTLLAFWSLVDSDNDTITANETLWYINNTKVEVYTNKTFINPSNTSKLENWKFSIRVFDSFGWSEFVNSSIIKILNAKPILNVNTTSIILSETQKVSISLSANDLDNDILNYTINDSRFFREGNSFIWNTNLSDSGLYNVNLTANDTADIDSVIINITIKDARDLDNDGNPDFNESDDDNDGIQDEIDFLIGNLSHINSNFPIGLAINGTSNLSKLFNGTYLVNITSSSLTIIEFNFTFNSSNLLDFGNLTINRTANGSSAVSIKGSLNLFGLSKSVFLEKINAAVKSVCVKDADVSFDSISPVCDSENETLIVCDNSTSGKYACLDTGVRYKITGLSHSAVKELCRDNDGDGYGTGCSAGADCNDNDASKTTDCPSGSGGSSEGSSSVGGGGGGGVICVSNWKCEEWLQCIDGFRNRECFDANQCAFPTKEPEVVQECAEEIKADIASTSRQIGMKDTTVEKAKSATQENLGISGGVTATIESENTSIGIFIVFLEVLLIVGAYLGIKMRFY